MLFRSVDEDTSSELVTKNSEEPRIPPVPTNTDGKNQTLGELAANSVSDLSANPTQISSETKEEAVQAENSEESIDFQAISGINAKNYLVSDDLFTSNYSVSYSNPVTAAAGSVAVAIVLYKVFADSLGSALTSISTS